MLQRCWQTNRWMRHHETACWQAAACVNSWHLGEKCDTRKTQGLLPSMLVSPGRSAGATKGRSTCGLVAMTSASHAEGRQFDPGQVYDFSCLPGHAVRWLTTQATKRCSCKRRQAKANPATRNRTRDHLIAAGVYSQMLYQLSYSRLRCYGRALLFCQAQKPAGLARIRVPPFYILACSMPSWRHRLKSGLR